jgi:hypothetical protein
MVGSLLAAFGAKADEHVFAGMIDMLTTGDEIAAASRLWQPLGASPAALALAHKLIATSKFVRRRLGRACHAPEESRFADLR